MKTIRSLKLDVFRKVAIRGKDEVAVMEVDGHIVVNPVWLDLRPAVQRMDTKTRTVAPSCVENICINSSMLTAHYAKDGDDGVGVLYDFLSLDFGGGNDNDPDVASIKDLACRDGVYIPLSALEAIGHTPHGETEYADIDRVRHVKYRLTLQSASENRLCRATFSTYPWESFAKTVSADADYLSRATQIPQKAVARLGLAKSGGTVVDGFDFTHTLVNDLMTDVRFRAKCYYDSDDTIKDEELTVQKIATDGHGWITPPKAKELASRLGLSYTPSAFQIRLGAVKGLLLVFDYPRYTQGRVTEDVIFSKSMWKADFDVSKARLLVGNVSKRQSRFCEWSYQGFISLSGQLNFDDIRPHLDFVRDCMKKALESPEGALSFLNLAADIEEYHGDADGDCDDGSDIGIKSQDICSSVDKLTAAIRANPTIAMQTKWIRRSIKKRIDLMARRLKLGKVPMPDSSNAVMGSDPLAYFNALRYDADVGLNFATGDYVVPENKRVQPLQAGQFYYGGFEGSFIAMRSPLTHHAQVRKLHCVGDDTLAHWLRPLDQLIVFNAFDETNLGMSGGDFDGDFALICKHKPLVDRFTQAPYIVYNNNNLSTNEAPQILTETLLQQTVRANLTQNMVGTIVNLNSRVQELQNSPDALKKFLALVSYSDNPAFIKGRGAQMPYLKKFGNIETTTAALERLNLSLTTLSELELDRVKTGYTNRFSTHHRDFEVPFTPAWFARIKGTAEGFRQRPAVVETNNGLGEPVRILTKQTSTAVKSVTDTLKSGKYGSFTQRTVELMMETESIMSRIHRYVDEEVLGDGLTPNTPDYCINETLASSPILNTDEARRIWSDVERLYKEYSRNIAAHCSLYKEGSLTDDEFNRAIAEIIECSSSRLRELSDDRAAAAYAAYVVSTKNNGSGSFAFLCVFDGMAALLYSTKSVDFYRIDLTDIIPRETTHVIVHRNRFRLPESLDPSKSFFGSASLPNGAYETYHDTKGGISLVIPKPADRSRLNQIPYAPGAEFTVKISYKLSELSEDHRNSDYISSLLPGATITFKEITSQGNLQYAAFADGTWFGTAFDDKRNRGVLAKEVIAALVGKEFQYVCTPEIRKNGGPDNNSAVTGTGTVRSAQVLMFK